MTGEGPARACFECGARPRLKGPLARVSARQVATVVHVPTGWVPLNTRPPLSRDIVSGFVTQAPMSWHGKAEQTVVLGGRSVSTVVTDPQQPPPWTSVRAWPGVVLYDRVAQHLHDVLDVRRGALISLSRKTSVEDSLKDDRAAPGSVQISPVD